MTRKTRRGRRNRRRNGKNHNFLAIKSAGGDTYHLRVVRTGAGYGPDDIWRAAATGTLGDKPDYSLVNEDGPMLEFYWPSKSTKKGNTAPWGWFTGERYNLTGRYAVGTRGLQLQNDPTGVFSAATMRKAAAWARFAGPKNLVIAEMGYWGIAEAVHNGDPYAVAFYRRLSDGELRKLDEAMDRGH